MASVNSSPIRTLFSQSTSFKWENIRSTNTCVQGKQLMIRDTGYAIYLFYFYLYTYPPDSRESDGGAIHKASNYPDLFPEMPRYSFPLKFNRDMTLI